MQSKVMRGSRTTFRHFFPKSRFIRNPRSRLPRRGNCRLLPTEEVFASLPLSLRQAFPLGGRCRRTATDEGQLHFRFKILNNRATPFPIFPLAFPFGESGEPPRADRGLLKYPLLPSLPLARLPLKCRFGNPKRKAPKTNYPQNNIINPQTGAAVFQPLPSL